MMVDLTELASTILFLRTSITLVFSSCMVLNVPRSITYVVVPFSDDIVLFVDAFMFTVVN